MAYDNNLSGTLFFNEKKTPDANPNLPDMTGTCEIGGKKIKISAWKKPGKDGKQGFLSLKFQLPENAPTETAPPPPPPSPKTDDFSW